MSSSDDLHNAINAACVASGKVNNRIIVVAILMVIIIIITVICIHKMDIWWIVALCFVICLLLYDLIKNIRVALNFKKIIYTLRNMRKNIPPKSVGSESAKPHSIKWLNDLRGKERKAVEKEMANWVNVEVGEWPIKCTYRRSYAGKMGGEHVKIHIVDYVTKSGMKCVGFVNPVTFSFIDPINPDHSISERIAFMDETRLIAAYCGFCVLCVGYNEEKVTLADVDCADYDKLKDTLPQMLNSKNAGDENNSNQSQCEIDLNKLKITQKIIFGQCTIYSYEVFAQIDDKITQLRGATDAKCTCAHDDRDPLYYIRAEYFFLGAVMNDFI